MGFLFLFSRVCISLNSNTNNTLVEFCVCNVAIFIWVKYHFSCDSWDNQYEKKISNQIPAQTIIINDYCYWMAMAIHDNRICWIVILSTIDNVTIGILYLASVSILVPQYNVHWIRSSELWWMMCQRYIVFVVVVFILQRVTIWTNLFECIFFGHRLAQQHCRPIHREITK